MDKELSERLKKQDEQLERGRQLLMRLRLIDVRNRLILERLGKRYPNT